MMIILQGVGYENTDFVNVGGRHQSNYLFFPFCVVVVIHKLINLKQKRYQHDVRLTRFVDDDDACIS